MLTLEDLEATGAIRITAKLHLPPLDQIRPLNNNEQKERAPLVQKYLQKNKARVAHHKPQDMNICGPETVNAQEPQELNIYKLTKPILPSDLINLEHDPDHKEAYEQAIHNSPLYRATNLHQEPQDSHTTKSPPSSFEEAAALETMAQAENQPAEVVAGEDEYPFPCAYCNGHKAFYWHEYEPVSNEGYPEACVRCCGIYAHQASCVHDGGDDVD